MSYVGRFGHDLLTQRDLTQPLDIVDPKTGIDYYTAASALSNLARSFALANNGGAPTNYYQGFPTTAQIGSVTAEMLGPTAQYWIDMLPPLRKGATQYTDTLSTGFVNTATNPTDGLIQEVFNLYYNPALSVIGDEIVGLADIDLYGGLGDNIGSGSYYFNGPPGLLGNNSGQFLNNQAISMYGWSSIGSSSYHALQANLRKQFSHGVQFDLNYTYSKSLDITSAASRVGFSVYGYQNIGLVGSRLANAFSRTWPAHPPTSISPTRSTSTGLPICPLAKGALSRATPAACWTLSSVAGSFPAWPAGPADFPSVWTADSAGPQTGS